MARAITHIVLIAVLLITVLPVQAQEAAFDEQNMSPAPVQPQPRPAQMTSSSGQESKSNLRHWSRFSQASASPIFVRVPAGTKCNSGGPRHYMQAQCVQPGSVKASAQPQNGPVKRYLAFNVPPGYGASGATSSKPSRSGATSSKKSIAPTLTKITPPQKHTIVLGYGSKIGEVTYTAIPASGTRTASISCYPRYR